MNCVIPDHPWDSNVNFCCLVVCIGSFAVLHAYKANFLRHLSPFMKNCMPCHADLVNYYIEAVIIILLSCSEMAQEVN